MGELARVVAPGGTLAMLEFGLPRGVWRPLWELYVRVGLPLAGAVVSPAWRDVGRFLGPSIRGFHQRIRLDELLARRRRHRRVRARAQRRRRCGRVGNARVSDSARPAFYALRSGGWRDYVTLLHPPYTLWHLSYAAMGAAIAPRVKWGLLGWTVLAFLLAMGVGAHALDELHGRPLKTRIPAARARVARARVDRRRVRDRSRRRDRDSTLWLLLFVGIGAFVVVAYNLELLGGILHTSFWFAFMWGAFPALTGYFASAHRLRFDAIAIAAFAFLTSLAQRRLSTEVRAARRQAGDASLARPEESALQLLAAALPLLAGALLLFRWRY